MGGWLGRVDAHARENAIAHECVRAVIGVRTACLSTHTCGHQLVRDERYAHDLARSVQHALCIVQCGSAHGK
jgi:hypothetical protein